MEPRGDAAGSPDFTALDEAYATYLDEHPDPPGGSLLAQTILTAVPRRELLPAVPVASGAHVLDVGTGFGPVLLETARLRAVRAVGIDVDEDVLAAATSVGAQLAGWLHPGASVTFLASEARHIACRADTFDLATARLVFQHLDSPEPVVAELWRVLKPGGRVVIFDVDDGFSVTYPPPSTDLAVLERAFSACQSERGGDREVGRKLSSYLTAAGFALDSIRPVARAQHLASEQGDASRTVNAARLRHVRSEIVARGLLTADEFERRLAAYESEPPVPRFRAECQLEVVAHKP